MISGGWDSRTLLAAAVHSAPTERFMGYSHGDLASREIHLAQRLAGETGIAFHQEPVDHRCYEIDGMRLGFEREEHLVFPHWHRAGKLSAQMGPRIVTAGVYGEVLGGHYGRAMLLQGSAKIREVLGPLISRSDAPTDASPLQLRALRQYLHLQKLDRPWPIHENWWMTAHFGVDPFNADIDHDLNRLRDRGVRTIDQLVEAYISEHRGSQYINAQVRSCRAYSDVSLPFVDRRLLELASALPLSSKIHNRINRELLRRFAPRLLRLPMAATLVAASRPLLFQEVSRFVRKGLELGRRRARAVSKGRIAAPRLSWVDFEFLRSGRELMAIADDLRAPLWDKPGIMAKVEQLARNPSIPTHPMSDQLMKVYTIDMALRST
jgi:hypothetical protein